MKKYFFYILFFMFTQFIFGQTDDELFISDIIIDNETEQSFINQKYGQIFENGLIKINGLFDTQVSFFLPLYADDDISFTERLAKSTVIPQAEALFSVDARPFQNLRMYTKFGLSYPFVTTAWTQSSTFKVDESYYTVSKTSINDLLVLKELFTDFSYNNHLFFRFGKHTVTWGTGYFFSPVSDIINLSFINPEDTEAQVDGPLNLRLQITFPDTQNCLWMYVIPSTDTINQETAESFLKHIALAGKMDIVVGGWEFGFGGLFQYEKALKAMATASGTIFRESVSVFAEAVYQYGTATQWMNDKSFTNKDSLFLLTAGIKYYWKEPQITFLGQYYYDSFKNDLSDLMSISIQDLNHYYFTKGHNIASMITFGKIFNNSKFTGTLFTLLNFGKESIPETLKSNSTPYNSAYINAGTFSLLFNWEIFDNCIIGAGPYVSFEEWRKPPVVSIRLSFILGGGKF